MKVSPIKLPNGDVLRSSHTGSLNVAELSPQACKVHIFPQLKGSLLGFGPLCDDDCTVILDKHTARVLKNGELILSGSRGGKNDLWYMDVPSLSIVPTNLSKPGDNFSNFSSHLGGFQWKYLHMQRFS